MKHIKSLLLVLMLFLFTAMVFAVNDSSKEQRGKFQKLYNEGNYKEAYEGFRKLALDTKDDTEYVGEDLKMAIACLRQINRVDETDKFIEEVVEVHKENWRLLYAAAQTYFGSEHNGYIIAGEFRRGHHRGGGKYVNSFERDRIRTLQLMTQAMQNTGGETNKSILASFYFEFARMLMGYRGYNDAWRLQYLSDFSQLPDYEEGYGYYYYEGTTQGAPVDPDGTPIYHAMPKSYQTAKSDGERWKWMLMQTMEIEPSMTNQVLMSFADFLYQQFGVQTMAYYGDFFRGTSTDEDEKNESGTFALHTLSEDETIARLATGIRRFKLPSEFNFITIYQQLADNPKGGYAEQSLNNLAQIFENRRQYDKATNYWKRSIKEYGPGYDNYKQKKTDQILGNWGQFEPVMTHPAGRGATVEYRFRNGTKVNFEAHEVNINQLLDDVKAYLKSNPRQLDWDRMNISNIGYHLVQKNENKYIGQKVADWTLNLKPRNMHFDKRITITTPLQKAGAYLLTAKMADGNISKIIIWINDTVIVKKQLDKEAYFFVADAVTGRPLPKVNVEFFGYRQENVKWEKLIGRQYNILTTNFAEFTDENGQVIPNQKDFDSNYQWIITAATKAGRFAYLGFTGVWYSNYYDYEYNQTKVFNITDRPVYRPYQPVRFKFWVCHAKYDQEDISSFANQDFTVLINNPTGEKVFEKSFTADAYGGFDGEYFMPKDAILGVYRIYILNYGGGGSFRVEEYKKPEFEVKINAPTETVMLGEKITVTIEANYYFGAPVTKAKVKYKILRSDYSANWYPIGMWDWFYGRGYWWFAYDYEWYPGWHQWGCKRPHWWWWPVSSTQPEVVAEAESEIEKDGTIKIDIDTALTKKLHGNTDHRYEITAEITDESRRTIVGKGTVLVARKPFKVYAWVDSGHYRVGDVIHANFSAQTLDNKPVKGKGVLNLYHISYKDNNPVETPIQKWNLDTDDEGKSSIQIKASKAGQYRLSYKVTDAKKHTIEGGYVFCISGEGFDGKAFRFNEIELVPDKKEYADGDKVRLMLNTDRAESTVVLFIRPANGIYLKPKIIHLNGKSIVEEIDITKKDMPNFFVEAFTISDGKLYTETREIIVPPEKRVLNVEVLPSSEIYKPGEKAKVKIKLTDFFGKPFTGSTVMSVYDKSVEYISGGSNVPEIREFFWKWRRSHYPRTESSFDRYFGNLVQPNTIAMQSLGVFGHLVADEEELSGSVSLRNGKAEDKMSLSKSKSMMPQASIGIAEGFKLDMMMEKEGDIGASGEGRAESEVVQPIVRTKFADTAFWIASLMTDKNGIAKVEFDMPENLTGWKIKTWAMGHGTKVGEGTVEVVTAKNLLLRMQAPRFFIEKDEVVLSANVHNYLKTDKSVKVILELEGKCLKPMGNLTKTITIEAGGEERVDWRVKVVEEGEAIIRMKALTDEESDAMQMKFPVYVHGMMKTVSYSGVIRPEQERAQIFIDVPKDRRVNESRLELRYSPSLAGAMVDALPYLVEYTYGCTEQVLNRFLPTVITQKVLKDMGIDLKDIQEKRTNLNAQEIADDVKRMHDWKRLIGKKRWDGEKWVPRNPVFDEETVRDMVKQGLKRLTAMQLSDGGWGWFSGWGEQSYPHTTALVIHGLQIARENDVAIVPGVLERGVEWLKNYQDKEVRKLKNAPTRTNPWKEKADNIDAFIYMVLADADIQDKDMREFLYRDRINLSVYAKAMYGMALYKQGHKEKLDMIIKNIEQYLVRDDENQTAYLNLPNSSWWWYWYGSEYEAHAYYLKLLSRIDPKSEKASGLVKYLLNNRKHATYWNSTRDTALCIEAMADYFRASGEDKPDMTLEVYIDGKKYKEVKINSENLFSFDNKFVLLGDAVETGKHKVEIIKNGKGPLYFNAYLSYFSLEDFINRAGLEIKVTRKYYKLTRVDKTVKAAGSRGQALDQKVEKYEREELANLSTLKSGDLVEIELEIESKNDYEYIIFEDMKAAGFEPVEVRSGYTQNGLGAYMELRDERVCFFVRALARGKHSVSYRMRAEIPGKFSALPTRASAMYAPELKGNSDEIKLIIE